jgi:ribonuclease R
MERLKFSKESLEEAASISLSGDFFTEREPVEGITIDAEHSKDLDDAIQLKNDNEKYELHVSISDVAAIIKPKSYLFEEALKRVSTKYVKDYNFPMLPRMLSEENLSLVENEIRPAITFSIGLDNLLEVTGFRVKQTAFKSRKKFSYAEVDSIIDMQQEHNEYNHLKKCYDLAARLLHKRQQSGALAVYDMIRGVYTNEEGQIIPFDEEHRHKSNIIVQEFMILVNSAASEFFIKKNKTFLLRNHTLKRSAPERDEIIHQYISALSDNKFLNTIQKRIDLWFNRADYSITVKGHFGLNLPAYTHITSPLRRMPDLINQLVLHSILNKNRTPFTKEKINSMAKSINKYNENIKDSKSKFFKKENIKKTIDTAKYSVSGQISNLDGKTFRTMLHQACQNNIINDELSSAITAKLYKNALGPEHLFCIIFEPPSGQDKWDELKKLVLIYLENNIEYSSQILEIAVSKKHLEKIDTDIIERQNGFCAITRNYRSGEILSAPEYKISSDKKNAKHLASLSFLFHFVNKLLVPFTDVKITDEMDKVTISRNEEIEDNYLNKLLEMSIKLPERPAPVFEYVKTGPSHNPVFTCKCSVNFVSGIKQTIAKANSKKSAKQLAAGNMIKLINDLIESGKREDVNPDNITVFDELEADNNYVGQLEELYRINKNFSSPEYSYEMKGPTNNAQFTAQCIINYYGEKFQTEALSVKKKTAKQISAKKMLDVINEKALYIKINSDEKIFQIQKVVVDDNYVGFLTGLCQLQKEWIMPQYIFMQNGTSSEPTYTCKCFMMITGIEFESIGSSYNKKSAKQLASKLMLDKLLIEFTDYVDCNNILYEKLALPYFSELKKIIDRSKFDNPQYDIYNWALSKSSTFTCKCTVNISNSYMETIGIGTTKIAAIESAAEKMFDKVTNIEIAK